MKLLDNYSDVSMLHFKAIDRRTINLWGEVTSKTLPIRIKKLYKINVSISPINHIFAQS